jgi:hypothetical protein
VSGEIIALTIVAVVHFAGAGVLIWALLDGEPFDWRSIWPTDDDGPGGPQAGDHLVIGRGDPLGAGGRAVGAHLAGDLDVVLDRDRHPGEGQRGAGRRRVDRGGLGEGGLGPDHPEGADPRVDRREVLEVRADHLHRGELPRAHALGDLRRRQADDLRCVETSASVHDADRIGGH